MLQINDLSDGQDSGGYGIYDGLSKTRLVRPINVDSTFHDYITIEDGTKIVPVWSERNNAMIGFPSELSVDIESTEGFELSVGIVGKDDYNDVVRLISYGYSEKLSQEVADIKVAALTEVNPDGEKKLKIDLDKELIMVARLKLPDGSVMPIATLSANLVRLNSTSDNKFASTDFVLMNTGDNPCISRDSEYFIDISNLSSIRFNSAGVSEPGIFSDPGRSQDMEHMSLVGTRLFNAFGHMVRYWSKSILTESDLENTTIGAIVKPNFAGLITRYFKVPMRICRNIQFSDNPEIRKEMALAANYWYTSGKPGIVVVQAPINQFFADISK